MPEISSKNSSSSAEALASSTRLMEMLPEIEVTLTVGEVDVPSAQATNCPDAATRENTSPGASNPTVACSLSMTSR